MAQARITKPALLALSTTVLVWAWVPLALKYFTHLLDPWTVNGIRYIFTALFWLPFVVRNYRTIPAGRNIWKDAAVPAAFHFMAQVGWGLAPYYNDASVMNFVSRVSFLFTILFGFLLLHDERLLGRSRLFWMGVGGTVLGLAAMFSGGLHIGNTSAFGMALLVWTAACWALYAVHVRKRMEAYPARLGFGIVSLMVAPGLVVLMLCAGDWPAAFHLNPWQWTLLATSAWLGIAMGHVLYYQAVRALGPVIAEGSLALIPFITAISAHLVLGERMLVRQWIGGTLLVIATLCLLLAKKRAATPIITEETAGG